MGLVNLINAQPGPQGWDFYWFANWVDHQEIQQEIQSQFSINFPIYVIEPWNSAGADNILLQHQLFHNDMNGITGVSGEDLSRLNFKDQQAVKDWIYQHYQEHMQVREVLGI